MRKCGGNRCVCEADGGRILVVGGEMDQREREREGVGVCVWVGVCVCRRVYKFPLTNLTHFQGVCGETSWHFWELVGVTAPAVRIC